MKLLTCTSEYPPYASGIGNVAKYVIDKFKNKGYECVVCSPTGPDIKLGSYRIMGKIGGGLKLIYFWYKVSKHFENNTNEYDAIWLHAPLFFLKKCPFPTAVVTIHTTYHGFNILHQKIDSTHFLRFYYKIMKVIDKICLKRLYRAGFRFTAVSPQVSKELEEIDMSKQRITYIPNGVDTEQFKPSNNIKMLRKKFGIPEDDLIILSLGRLTEAKQPQKLIEVFSVIEEEIEGVTLVIAGRGELLEKTKKIVIQNKLMDVRFLGYVDHEKEAPDLYACSDYYIMTSKYEGLPLTLLEAMASGLPCIVSDIPNLRIVEDANCGIVVDFDDTEKVAADIIKYLERDNSGHSKNARGYAVNNLDWKIIAERYLEEFEEVLSKEWR